MTQQDFERTTGVELEVFLADYDGALAHTAHPIIEELKKEDPSFTGEPSCWQLEAVSGVHNNTETLLEEMVDKYEHMQKVANKHDSVIVPLATVLSPTDEPIIRMEDDRYRKILERYGEKFVKHWGNFNGIHVHLSSLGSNEELVRTYNLLRQAEALAALTTTSIGYKGKRDGANSRVPNLASLTTGFTHGDYLAQRAPRVEDMDELRETLNQRMEYAREELMKRNFDLADARPEKYNNRIALRPANPEAGKHVDTIEWRVADAARPEYAAALGAALLGISRRLDDSDYVKRVFEQGQDEHLLPLFEKGVIYEPTEAFLEDMDRRWVRNGIHDDRVHAYVTQLLDLAETGLYGNEHEVLAPLRYAARTRRAPGDIMLSHVEFAKPDNITHEEAMRANKAASNGIMEYQRAA